MKAPTAPAPMPPEHRKVIAAAGLGALFEWYDFYLYGVLAPVLAATFFAQSGDGAAVVSTLLAFAAGFVVRPVGALLFGRLGDLIGRKYTFLYTLVLMGAATFAIGVLPGFQTIGVAAPIALVGLRLLQGLAIGGEYGGVVTYVAEHAPAGRRGFYTGWIQATASLGLLLALLVVVGTRHVLGEEAFAAWGWRLPFLLSAVLLGLGIWIRLSLSESPMYRRLKQSGGATRSPLAEAFGRWRHLRWVLVALFGLVAGQAVVWYTGQFQALFFMTLQLKVDPATASLLLCAALALAAPLFVAFGSLSDRVGRKPVILGGMVLAALATWPLFEALTRAANPALAHAQANTVAVLQADPASCGRFFDLTLAAPPRTVCELAQRRLSERAVRYARVDASGTGVLLRIGGRTVELAAGGFAEADFAKAGAGIERRLTEAIDAAGYPARADPARIDHPRVVAILLALIALVAMVYGPIAAALVELFPTRIRCSALSLPYHIGNGWFGGLLPGTAFALAAYGGDALAGLWYGIAVALGSATIGLLCLPETRGRDLEAIGSDART